MNKYEVTRTYTTTEYCVVYANSEKEAKEKAIDINNWQDEGNNSTLNFEYTIDKEYENNQR